MEYIFLKAKMFDYAQDYKELSDVILQIITVVNVFMLFTVY